MSSLRKLLYGIEAVFVLIYSVSIAFDKVASQIIPLFIICYLIMLPIFSILNKYIEKHIDK